MDDLGQPGVQAARNVFLMNILEDLPAGENGETLCEHRGSGIAAMLAALRRAGMQPPIFEDRVISFQVTFSNASLLDMATLRWLEQVAGRLNLSDAQRLALAYLRQRTYMANQDYCRLTGVDSRVATRELAELVQLGLVVRHSTRRRATYALAEALIAEAREEPSTTGYPVRGTARLAPSVPEPPGTRIDMAPARTRRPARTRVAEVLSRGGEFSAQQLARISEASLSSVRLALRELVSQGLVQPVAGARKSPRQRYRWIGPRP